MPRRMVLSAVSPLLFRDFMIRSLVLVLLAAPCSADAADAGHVGLALTYDDYGSDAFMDGRSGDDPASWSPALVAQYVREPSGWLEGWPALGIGIGRWNSSFKGNCCGFSGAEVDAEFTNLDLLVANFAQRGAVREVWYLLGGVSSVDVATDFDTDAVAGITAGRESAAQVGFGFFAGKAGGFTGGFELRHTRLSDFGVTTARFSVGGGF